MTNSEMTNELQNSTNHFRSPGHKRTLQTGLTLKEAKAHCQDPETSSSTVKNPTTSDVPVRLVCGLTLLRKNKNEKN